MDHKPPLSTALQPVSELRRGEHARVRLITGDRLMARRIAMLGIRPGVEVRVAHGPGARGAVLLAGGTRIALGREIIEHILVEPHAAAHDHPATGHLS